MPDGFQHILRVLNTNIDGKQKIMYGLTSIKVRGKWLKITIKIFCGDFKIIYIFQGVGRRYANLVCKKAEVDMNKRAGELTEDEVHYWIL